MCVHFPLFLPCGPSFPFILALWHFDHVGFHFLSFWPCGLSCPCILALWAFISLHFRLRPFISLHFGLLCLYFLASWLFGGQLLRSPPQVFKKRPVHFGLVGLHFLSFWPCGPSFPCILALWAFISLHFGLVGFHFLAFWPFGPCRKRPVLLRNIPAVHQRRGRVNFPILAFPRLAFRKENPQIADRGFHAENTPKTAIGLISPA